MMADNKKQAQQGKQDVLDQGGVGFTPEDGGNNQGGQNRQSANAGSGQQAGAQASQQSGSQSSSSQGSGQYTGGAGAGESRQSGFVHSSPDANVFPAGKPQADNPGHRGGDSAAGTPDEGRLGGSGGTSAAGTTGNDPDR
jgi:hypothetical protein